ncbi:hypothetical protein Aph01nite_54450 [Acrocarpospora phusangensis]|uniref:Uncharacterized protein n=1 Tax=Acrocarpospora phusangensis TaxID=1070424 RepID=A0A919QGT0_9ACTN|nr:hypothetical protein [Acrocarpospora phusangensis]GIH27135.1 hypothetical protein Aph01nite_54450 [Acrocarpospora phusangensis]
MAAFVSVSGDDVPDQLRDLYAWLSDESEIRGRVRLREAPPKENNLGTAVDALQLLLGAGGGAATAASVVVAWLSNRRGEVSVKLTRGDKSLEVTAKGVKAMNADGLRELTDRIAEVLNEDEGGQ